MTQSLILRNVTKYFGDVTAVGNLSFQLEQGECFSMLGPSGCGKTTTLRMIAGFEDLDEGEILLRDKVISSRPKNFYLPPEKRDFGMVFQAFAVWPHLTVAKNVSFPLEIRGLSRGEINDKTRKALEYTGLLQTANSYPNELSGGQKQRIALARSISFNPQVMLLDEPLSNLDQKMREEMRFEIKDLQRKFNFTVIYVTHDQAEAMALSDRIMVMSMGGVVEQLDTPINVYTNPANRFVFEFIGLSSLIPVEIGGGQVYVAGESSAGAVCEASRITVKDSKPLLACRPADIDFDETGVRGIVKQKIMLGETIDYRVSVGSHEVRIQKNIRRPQVEVGQPVALTFRRTHWFGA
jgi:iron(III) transport system ATP-binding protein